MYEDLTVDPYISIKKAHLIEYGDTYIRKNLFEPFYSWKTSLTEKKEVYYYLYCCYVLNCNAKTVKNKHAKLILHKKWQ